MGWYRKLLIWEKSFQLSLKIYRTTQTFPKQELFGLVSQMRRASVSIPSNIAEGHSRKTTREYIRFLLVALGSTAELETQLFLAKELKYIAEENFIEIHTDLTKIAKMLNKTITTLKERVKGSERDVSLISKL